MLKKFLFFLNFQVTFYPTFSSIKLKYIICTMKLLLLFPLLIINFLVWAQPPTANFTISPTKGCVGDPVTITSTSTAGAAAITNYVWSAPGAVNESGSGSSSFTTSYNSPGTYSFSLIVQSADGLSDIETKLDVLVVSAKPTADITSNVTNCNAPFSTTFGVGGSSSGPGITYSWVFAGGSPATGSGATPTSNFASVGTNNITLTVSDANTGCSSTVTESLTLANYTADFTMKATACVGESVPFTDASTTGTNQWAWTFQNGTAATSVAQNPSIGFTSEGTKDITLIATNTLTGCTDTQTKQITILALPIPSFTQSLDEACAVDSIIFTNTSTSPGGATFSWNFGDGTTPFVGQTPPVHDYTTNGTFFPILTMTGSNGCVATFRDTITLWNPLANFSLDVREGCAPMPVTFTDLSDAPRPITNWFWDFGDGTTSTLQNPQHTFQCGRYDVSLIIRIEGGCRDTISLLTADTLDNVGTTGLTTLFDSDPGNDYLDSLIRYGETLDVDFTFDKRVVCAAREPIELSSLTPINCPYLEGELEYVWSMNGVRVASSIDSVYSHIFGDTMMNGPISVNLAINFNGCISEKDSLDQFWTMAPVAAFFPVTSQFCNLGPSHTVSFIDTLSVYGHGSIINFAGTTIPSQLTDDVEVSYDFGDGSPIITITDDTQLEDIDKGFITHTYTNYGIYTAIQTITNNTTGCVDDQTRQIAISFIDATLDPDSVCIDGSITFNVQTNTFIDHPVTTYTYGLYDGPIVSGIPNLTHPHTTAGVFTESVIARNSAGCAASASNTFHVFALPIADINLLSDSVCENTSTQFDPSTSTFGGFTTNWDHFDWTFTDGTAPVTTSDFSPLTTNPVPLGGSVTVTLIATDGFGCVSLPVQKTIYTQKPDAQFNLASIVCDGVPGMIDAAPTTGNGPLTYQWSLDGTIVGTTPSEPFGYLFNITPDTDLTQNHTYLLTVFDNKGCVDTISKQIAVRNPQIDTVITAKQGFSIDGTGGFACPPVAVDFDITTSSTDPIVDYSWSLGFDFDTDIDSKNEDPTGIQYSQSGTYDYTVTVLDANGCPATHTFSDYLFIDGPAAIPVITLDPNDLCGQTYIFEVTNSSKVSNWSWSLGDGTVYTNSDFPSDSFNYRFLETTSYDATLTIYDSLSDPVCPVTLSSQNIIIPDNGINANFTASPTLINYGNEVLLHDLSTSDDPIVTWVWNYGDGLVDTMSNGNDVSHQYFMQGNIPIELTIIDDKGCTDKARLVIFSEVVLVMPDIITGVGGIGPNSIWTLFADIFIDFKILIVNRWGNVVYEGSRNNLDPRYLWDGIDYKSGKPCVDGTYFWILEGTLINGQAVKEHGYLSLLGSKSE